MTAWYYVLWFSHSQCPCH